MTELRYGIPKEEISAAGKAPPPRVRVGGKRVMDNSTLDQIHVADPVAQEMCRMRLEIERLHGELNSCRREKSKLTAQKAEKNKEE